jgi:hypothetical protein
MVIGLAAAHTFVAIMSQSMNEDGISYLDMGAAFIRGDWDTAVNGIWSPLYGWLLGVVVHLAQPSLGWEFPVAQIVNFCIFVLALACFEYFWRRMTEFYYGNPDDQPGASIVLPRPIWMILGYVLFAYCALNLVEIWAVTPDMLVAATVFMAAGLVFDLYEKNERVLRKSLLLGLVLGFGYFAKAAMLPLAAALLGLTLLLRGSPAVRLKRFVLSSVACALVATPLITALSIKYGEPMFSGIGKFTYLKHVNDMPYPNFFPEVERFGGQLDHPPTRIFDDPPVYAFAEPIGGTYPMAYDPSYWTAGLVPDVSAGAQLRTLATSAMFWFDLFVREQGGFVACLLLLLLLSIPPTARRVVNSPIMVLFIWSLAAFGLYSLVHITPRYIAPFVVLFLACLLALVRLRAGSLSHRFSMVGGGALVAFTCLNIFTFNLAGLAGVVGFKPAAEAAVDLGKFGDEGSVNHVEFAGWLYDEGLQREDRIAFIGYSFTAQWAHLAKLKIVAEIYPEHVPQFWNASPDRQAAILRSLYDVGVDAIIAEPYYGPLASDDWRNIGDTDFLIHARQPDISY